MTDKTKVTLLAPVKIGGKWHKTGETVSVSNDDVAGLASAGAIAADGQPAASVSQTVEDSALFEKMLAEAVERSLDDAVFKKTEEIQKAADERVAMAEATAAEAATLIEQKIAEIQEEARKASTENIGNITAWLKVAENAASLKSLSDVKAAKAVGEALGRDVTVAEFKVAATVLELTK